jgi:hypothetical protein
MSKIYNLILKNTVKLIVVRPGTESIDVSYFASTKTMIKNLNRSVKYSIDVYIAKYTI